MTLGLVTKRIIAEIIDAAFSAGLLITVYGLFFLLNFRINIFVLADPLLSFYPLGDQPGIQILGVVIPNISWSFITILLGVLSINLFICAIEYLVLSYIDNTIGCKLMKLDIVSIENNSLNKTLLSRTLFKYFIALFLSLWAGYSVIVLSLFVIDIFFILWNKRLNNMWDSVSGINHDPKRLSELSVMVDDNQKQKIPYSGIMFSITFIFIFITSILVSFNFIQAQVNGPSMNDTLDTLDMMVMDKNFKRLERGRIVGIKREGEGNAVIKRIIGLPGESIEIFGSRVVIYDENDEPYILRENYLSNAQILFQEGLGEKNYIPKTKIPDGEYYVLGDNRINSLDSRYYGTVKRREIVGIAYIRYAKDAGQLNSEQVHKKAVWEQVDYPKYRIEPISEVFEKAFEQIKIEATKKTEIQN